MINSPDEQASIGVYIHIPYCRTICPYCDFDRQSHGLDRLPDYVDALVADIGRQQRHAVHSVFFGGGTPSLLAAAQVDQVLTACRSGFRINEGAEITLEANPGDLTANSVSDYVAAGVNRLSLGVQSLDDRLLRIIGRRHSAVEAIEAVHSAREGGMANISLDLMYGLPAMDLCIWQDTLQQALDLRPEHLSCYLLTVDERVPLGRDVLEGRLVLPEDDDLAGMYQETMDTLAAAGFEQYEISNWAKPGRRSRHNLTYWQDEPYLGFGSGAASSFHGRRWKNDPDPSIYIDSVAMGVPQHIEDELTDPETRLADFVGLQLRLRDGLDPTALQKRFNTMPAALFGDEIEALEATGHLEWHQGRLRIAAGALFVTNEVVVRLLGAIPADRVKLAVG